MKRTLLLTMILGVLAVGLPAADAGAPHETASRNFRLLDLQPNSGQARMASRHFRMDAVVAPPPSAEMKSERFRIRPLPADPKTPPAGRRILVLG